MVTPIDLRPSQASQGGRNPDDRDATIISAYYGERPWTKKNQFDGSYEPVYIASGPNQGKQTTSCSLFIELSIEGEEETFETTYDIGSGYIFSPAVLDPTAPGGVYKREKVGQYMVAFSTESGNDANSPRPAGNSEFMKFITELSNSPNASGPNFDVNRLAGEEPIEQVLVGLNMHWARCPMPKRNPTSTYEPFIYAPTRINSVAAAQTNVPAPPPSNPIAGGSAVAEVAPAVDLHGTIQPLLDTFMGDTAQINTMPNFIAYLTIQNNMVEIPNLNDIFKYLTQNPSYPTEFGYTVADDGVSINGKS